MRNLLAIAFVLVALLHPPLAWAGWGDENWGEMVWGGAAPPIPSVPVEGIALLTALLLVLSYALFALRRRRAKRSPLHS